MNDELLVKPQTKRRVLTYGLTHVALKVKDLDRTIKFYRHIFNVKVMYLTPTFAQVTTPGANDIIVFEKSKSTAIGKTGGLAHIGFRLQRAADIELIIKRILEAGGVIKEKGEFIPGSPYVFFYDPDGYEIEVWYELLSA
jgi:catechol 2,3-dioxygenase-like lactoylglutathione lyase family enzyme